MAYTYSWDSLITIVRTLIKNVPLDKLTPCCDLISAEMYNEYPWKGTITNTAKGTIPLLDSTQDYSCSAPNINRLVKAWIRRYDVTPNEARDLDVVKDLSVNLYPISWTGLRAVSLQQSLGLFRLESAVQVASGTQLELCCDYQINVQKVVNLSQSLWFDDRFAIVAIHGLLWWAYVLTDDARAGSGSTDAAGRVIAYNGQLGTYKAAVNKMKIGEDSFFTEQLFPAEPFGLPRDGNALNIFGS